MFDDVLTRYLPSGPLEALELGCYPGGFMTYLHQRFGYRVSGIDFVSGTAALADVLQHEGTTVGSLTEADLLTVTPRPTYDVVASFGLIEHFPDPALAIAQHAAWLRPGGTLVLTVPHFRRLQWVLHRLVDRASLRAHNVQAMSRPLLASSARTLGLDVLHLGFVGVCGFWVEPDPGRGWISSRIAQGLERALGGIDRRARESRFDLSNPVTSPFLVCIARRAE